MKEYEFTVSFKKRPSRDRFGANFKKVGSRWYEQFLRGNFTMLSEWYSEDEKERIEGICNNRNIALLNLREKHSRIRYYAEEVIFNNNKLYFEIIK
jgi:hypothetical protein